MTQYGRFVISTGVTPWMSRDNLNECSTQLAFLEHKLMHQQITDKHRSTECIFQRINSICIRVKISYNLRHFSNTLDKIPLMMQYKPYATLFKNELNPQ